MTANIWGFYLTGSINVPTMRDAFQLVGSRLQPGAALWEETGGRGLPLGRPLIT